MLNGIRAKKTVKNKKKKKGRNEIEIIDVVDTCLISI